MTEKLYDKNSHLSEFEAKVLSCQDNVAVLDRTAFFPEGGGQTADTGFLDGIRVLDVQEKDGTIYHYLEKDLEEGKTVKGTLNWEERFDKMQNHSGEHIISGIVRAMRVLPVPVGPTSTMFDLSNSTSSVLPLANKRL